MQRLFSAFPEGWPGTGLALLRAIAAIPLAQCIAGASPQPVATAFEFLAASGSVFLVLGLWTPIAASLMAISEVALSFSSANALSMHLVMAVLGASLAMIGPGAWSVDAHLFGRKRIRIPQR